jgi:hypothetical protein
VFGQDHIGMIILVYHVLNTNQDTAYFLGAKDDSSGSGSSIPYAEGLLVIDLETVTRE